MDLFRVNFDICCEVGIQIHSFVCEDPIVTAPFVEETVLFSLNDFGTLIENQVSIDAWVYLSDS